MSRASSSGSISSAKSWAVCLRHRSEGHAAACQSDGGQRRAHLDLRGLRDVRAGDRPGADRKLRRASSDIVALNLSNYCRRIIPLAKQHGKPMWCDVHDYDGKNEYHRDFIAGADVITMSSDAMPDYQAVYGKADRGREAARDLHARAQGINGADGRRALDRDASDHELSRKKTPTARAMRFSRACCMGIRAVTRSSGVCGLDAVTAGLCVTSSELYDPSLSAEKVDVEYIRHWPPSPL